MVKKKSRTPQLDNLRFCFRNLFIENLYLLCVCFWVSVWKIKAATIYLFFFFQELRVQTNSIREIGMFSGMIGFIYKKNKLTIIFFSLVPSCFRFVSYIYIYILANFFLMLFFTLVYLWFTRVGSTNLIYEEVLLNCCGLWHFCNILWYIWLRLN